MTAKRVKISKKPARGSAARRREQWVKARNAPANKRLTIDISAELHAQIKSQCAANGVNMADEIRALLHKEFAT